MSVGTFRGLALLLTCLVATVVLFASVRYTQNDAKATLLVSESIIARGTIRLDHYGESALREFAHAVQVKNGHYYDYFPVGTPILSVPFVAVAKLLGMEMLASWNSVQVGIAAVVSSATFLLLVLLAREFLDSASSLALSVIFWFGTSLASTGATALWSHDFAALLASLAIFLLVARFPESGSVRYAIALGLVLFLAYLCRPTLSLLIPFALAYVLLRSRTIAAQVSLVLAGLFCLLFLLSYHEYGQPLPDYYMPRRLQGGHFLEALYGGLLSPARGLFVFSPFLLAGLARLPTVRGWFGPWLLLGLGWPACHVLVVSTFPHWWAGHSYGARLMTEMLPGLFLVMLVAWPRDWRAARDGVFAGFIVLASAFGIFANTYQGLFNRSTMYWNAEPNIDVHPEYLFDWRHPQFLASPQSLEERILLHRRRLGSHGTAPVVPASGARASRDVAAWQVGDFPVASRSH
jgi:hypothetical protein